MDSGPPQQGADLRPAATVIVAREASGGLEFLVLLRSASSRFLPNFVVFPGGVVEDQDRALASSWFGGEDEAARACALRELAEEAGLVMTANGLIEAPGRLPGQPDLPPPDPGAMPEIARWVAPEFLPVRFDARFFALGASPDVEPHPDGMEAARAWWTSAEELLDGARTGETQLMWPTLKTLETLAGCSTLEEVLSLRIEQVPPPVRSS
ncbi:MAG TPA: NUDIX domain-containing protein [Actinomycetota bacterium]|nr:NUDIX domain-containing protein [Actinomycetota bacterium]